MDQFPDFSEYGYQVQRELGHNRAGGRVTYLAIETGTEQPVVIKQFQFARTGANWTDFEACDREMQALRGLEHPGIPHYLDSFQTDGGFCMVQEYKQADSLAEPRSFSPEEIRCIAASALEILVYLQNRIPPVIHRDIKPENILVDDRLRVYLVDFGFARIGDGEVGVSSVVKGTLGFMPPEQLFNRELTEASDLYGLGITLICLLTNTRSTNVGSLIDITYRVNFKHLVPKLSTPWVNWLEKLSEPRLKDRFPNATSALAAMPQQPMRQAEVRLSQSNLELVARRPGEVLSGKVKVFNPVPDTLLEGRWEVASHPSDPPHSPQSHAWIQVQPPTFVTNQGEYQILVDTSRLIPGKTYSRKLLLHTNALSHPYSLDLEIKPAAGAIRRHTPSYGPLFLLFSFSLTVAWLTGWVVMITQAMAETAAVLGFATAGAAFGFEAAALLLAWLEASTGAIAGVIAGIVAGAIALLLAAMTTDTVGEMAGLLVAGISFLSSVIAGTGMGLVVENLARRPLPVIYAVLVGILTMALGTSLGLGLLAGLGHPLVLAAIAVTAIPLSGTLAYFPLQRLQRQVKYREPTRSLIKP